MELYIRPDAEEFEKSAAEVDLPEDANAWPSEVMQELYKQLPYIADYDPDVVMERTDAERGYGLGYVVVSNRTTAHAEAPAGAHKVRIPLIVKSFKLQPLDVLILENGKMLPLTEGRLRQALVRPQIFDAVYNPEGTDYIANQLLPQQRQGYGSGSGAVFEMGKLAGKKPGQKQSPSKGDRSSEKLYKQIAQIVGSTKTGSMLATVLPTANASDHARTVRRLSDPSMRPYLHKHAEVLAPFVRLIAEHQSAGTEKTAGVLRDLLKPTVAQVVKAPQGYVVKTASHKMWEPEARHLDRGEVVRAYGEKIALAADTEGSVTIADEGVRGSTEESRAEVVSTFGRYKVKTPQGEELVGFVFPNLYDVDGQALPIALFTDGTHACLQSQIVGESYMGGAPLEFASDGPSGQGCFVRVHDGAAEATVPMTVQGRFTDPSGPRLYVTLFDGTQMFVVQQPHIKRVAHTGDMMLVPEGWRWLPLGDAKSVSLISDRSNWGVEKTAARVFASVEVRADGANCFYIQGPPVEKVAHQVRDLSLDDALFLFGGLGTDLRYASEKLAEAVVAHGPVRVRVGRYLTPAEELRKEASRRAADFLSRFPDMRRDLIKEATFIADPLAVDTVLSLGFINPDNILTFVSYLPQIELSQSRLCELLMASRLGVSDIPTTPLERAIRMIEEVVDGLKTLAFQKA